MAFEINARRAVWSYWTLNTILSAVYLGLTMSTFSSFKDGIKLAGDIPDSVANGVLASCVLGFLMVFFWIIYSLLVLLGCLSNYHIGYGIMLGTCTHTGFLLLLAGLVIQSNKDMANSFMELGFWRKSNLQVCEATYAFCYILCTTFLIMFPVMFFTSRSMMVVRVGRVRTYLEGPQPMVMQPQQGMSNIASVLSGGTPGHAVNWHVPVRR